VLGEEPGSDDVVHFRSVEQAFVPQLQVVNDEEFFGHLLSLPSRKSESNL